MYTVREQTGKNTLGMDIKWWEIVDEYFTVVAETRYEKNAGRICDMFNCGWHKQKELKELTR